VIRGRGGFFPAIIYVMWEKMGRPRFGGLRAGLGIAHWLAGRPVGRSRSVAGVKRVSLAVVV
jgi:hypothetical protein